MDKDSSIFLTTSNAYHDTIKAMLGLKNIKCTRYVPAIKKVIFNDPATIVIWCDNTKTVVKAGDELFDPEKGLAMAISKKALGNKGNYFNEFKKWLPEDYEDAIIEKSNNHASSAIVFGLLRSMSEKMELCEKAYDSVVKVANTSKDAEDALVYLKLILNK